MCTNYISTSNVYMYIHNISDNWTKKTLLTRRAFWKIYCNNVHTYVHAFIYTYIFTYIFIHLFTHKNVPNFEFRIFINRSRYILNELNQKHQIYIYIRRCIYSIKLWICIIYMYVYCILFFFCFKTPYKNYSFYTFEVLFPR